MTERFTPTDQQAAQERIAALRAELEADEVLGGADDVLGDSARSNTEVGDFLSSIPKARGYTSSVRSQSPKRSTADAFGLDHGGSKRR